MSERGEWVRVPRNTNDDLDTGWRNAAYEARLEALPFDLLREVAGGSLTIEEAESEADGKEA